MIKLFTSIIILISILFFSGCGGSNTSTRSDPLAIEGTFVGKDNSDRDATVAVDGPNNTIAIALKTDTVDIELEGNVILTSIASSGKKLATGDITYNVDLEITKSTLTGFTIGGISKGTIIKKVDDIVGTLYTCAFNFTTNSVRGTDTADSDWSMSGTKAP